MTPGGACHRKCLFGCLPVRIGPGLPRRPLAGHLVNIRPGRRRLDSGPTPGVGRLRCIGGQRPGPNVYQAPRGGRRANRPILTADNRTTLTGAGSTRSCRQ